MAFSLGGDLTGHLLVLDEHELGGFQWRKADENIDDAEIDVVLGGGFLVALDEIGVARRRALEGALTEKTLQKGTDIESYLRPERLVIRFEHDPLQGPVQGFF